MQNAGTEQDSWNDDWCQTPHEQLTVELMALSEFVVSGCGGLPCNMPIVAFEERLNCFDHNR
jgi:hypothetical protein